MKHFSVVLFFILCFIHCINGNICKSYNSSTEIFSYGINLDLVYEFTKTSYILTIKNFTSTISTSVTVESYSADTQTQKCEVQSSSPYKKCVLKLSKLSTYDISVHFDPDLHIYESTITTIIYNGSQVINPRVSVENPCVASSCNMFDIFIYGFSLILSVMTFVSALYFMIFLLHTIYILPKSLRLYYSTCYLPIVLISSLFRATYAVIYLCILREDDNIFLDIIESSTPFLSQFVRHFFFSFVMERIIATIYLTKYSLPNRMLLFWVLSSQTVITSLLYGIFLCYNKYISFALKPIRLLSYTTTAVHFATFIIFFILFLLNSKWYKASAYRTSLNKRHQMVENVKVLSFMFPIILIYTAISPLGSLVQIISFYFQFTDIPYCVMHIFNNLPHLLIFVRGYIIHVKQNKCLKINPTITTIKSVIGKDLPAALEFDKYFKDLQQQWK